MANQTGNMSDAQNRLSQVAAHLNATDREGLLEKRPDDIVVTAALRTPITKGGKGGFKDTAAADLLHGAFISLIERSGIDPKLVEDIAVGNVLAPGAGATEFRAAALAAGFSDSTAVRSLSMSQSHHYGRDRVHRVVTRLLLHATPPSVSRSLTACS